MTSAKRRNVRCVSCEAGCRADPSPGLADELQRPAMRLYSSAKSSDSTIACVAACSAIIASMHFP